MRRRAKKAAKTKAANIKAGTFYGEGKPDTNMHLDKPEKKDVASEEEDEPKKPKVNNSHNKNTSTHILHMCYRVPPNPL